MASLRSSTRTTPRKKYTVDAFEGIQDLLRYSSESDGQEPQQGDREGGDDESQNEEVEHEEAEDDFEADAAESDSDDETMSGLDELGPVKEVNEAGSDAGEDDVDDSISIVEDAEISKRTPKTRTKQRRKRTSRSPENERARTRGVLTNVLNHVSKPDRMKWLFGATKEEQRSVLEARNRWTHKQGLPSRKSQIREDCEGFVYQRAYQTDIENAQSNWRWYHGNGGREAFQQRQTSRNLSLAEVGPYLPTDFELRSFVMGPVRQRKLYSMKIRQWVSMSAAFASEPQARTNGMADNPSWSDKKGFILNLGAKVQSLDWAPNQDGKKQYLAANVRPSNKAGYPAFETSGAPSFTSQPPHPSNIQIWEFSTNAINIVDDALPPRLNIVLCMNIGDIKFFKWCPVPRKDTAQLGLLACVSSDGAIRVLDVPAPSNESRTINILIEKFAFQSRPPNTVCTSLTWISSSRVAAACANGFVAVWDIDKALQFANENPRPVIYTDISTSYITSITSCYPSFPHMVATTSMNGYVTLTDLRQPNPSSHAATTQYGRTRIGQSLIMWNDFACSGVSVEDNQTVRCYPLRSWFSGIATGKLKGQVTSMAVSLCHPYVLIGSSAGEVTGHNPVRRLVDSGRSPLTQQRWFTHEWRRSTEDEREAAEMADIDPSTSTPNAVDMHTLVGKDGLSRITDGFKPQDVVLHSHSANTGAVKDNTLCTTIYEKKSAVTALAWNPNVHVGGWAAAGMADGLLKVEDVALEQQTRGRSPDQKPRQTFRRRRKRSSKS